MIALERSVGYSVPQLPGSLLCSIKADLPPVGLSALGFAGGQAAYRLGGRGGEIPFEIDYLGLFSGRGQIRRYSGRLLMPRGEAAIAGIEFAIEPSDIAVSWPDVPNGMRPADPAVPIRFRSSAVTAQGPGRWSLRGLLALDSTPRLQMLDVALVDRGIEAITGTEIAEFALTGSLLPALYGRAEGYSAIALALRLRVELDSRA